MTVYNLAWISMEGAELVKTFSSKSISVNVIEAVNYRDRFRSDRTHGLDKCGVKWQKPIWPLYFGDCVSHNIHTPGKRNRNGNGPEYCNIFWLNIFPIDEQISNLIWPLSHEIQCLINADRWNLFFFNQFSRGFAFYKFNNGHIWIIADAGRIRIFIFP